MQLISLTAHVWWICITSLNTRNYSLYTWWWLILTKCSCWLQSWECNWGAVDRGKDYFNSTSILQLWIKLEFFFIFFCQNGVQPIILLFFWSCHDRAIFPHWTDIGPWRMAKHICVPFQSSTTILGTIAEPSEDERPIMAGSMMEGYMMAMLGLGKFRERAKRQEEMVMQLHNAAVLWGLTVGAANLQWVKGLPAQRRSIRCWWALTFTQPHSLQATIQVQKVHSTYGEKHPNLTQFFPQSQWFSVC